MIDPQDTLEDFGLRLGEFRRLAGMTQAELGERSGVGRSNVSQIENGRRDLQLTTVARLAAALEIELSALFEGMR